MTEKHRLTGAKLNNKKATNGQSWDNLNKNKLALIITQSIKYLRTYANINK